MSEKVRSTRSHHQGSTLTQVRKEEIETLTTIVLSDPQIITVPTKGDTLVKEGLDLEAGLLKGIIEVIDEHNKMYVIFNFQTHFHISLKLIRKNF